MRLTLRSLLGYLDDLLEPEDAQEIGKKVAESSVATNLLHRIRDVTRRLRLGAPNVMERGTGLDPNTVAEYLDHSLPASQVPDFEKVCLESDVHLAEVASCHQVLAIVLGEPAEVDPDSRQRMYQLPDLVAASRAAAVSEEPARAPPETFSIVTELPSGPKPEPPATRPRVPQYVGPRSSPPQKWKMVVSLTVVLLIAGSLLWLGGRFRGDRPWSIGSLLSENVASKEEPRSDPLEGSGGPARPATRGEQQASPEDKVAIRLAPPLGEPAARDAALPAVSAGPIRQPEEEPPGAEPALRQPEGALGSEARPRLPANVESPSSSTSPRPPAEATPPPPQRIGLFTTPKEVLLRIDPQGEAWRRLGDQAVLGSYDRLLALPTCRPVAVLTGRIQMELVDGTVVQFLPFAPPGIVGVLLEHGHLILKADEAGSRLRLQVGEWAGVVAFDEAGSVLAVEAVRLEGPGDPETQPGPTTASAYVVTGKIVWQEEPKDAPVPLTGPDRLTLGAQAGEKRSPRQIPRWITDDMVSSLDKRAALVVERSLIPDRTVRDGLIELAKRQQREVRWLAARSLALTGEFKPLLDVLSNSDHKLLWPDYIELLRAAVVRGPQSAAAVRTAMEKTYGPEGSGLYEMLWRYRVDTLRREDAAQLVSFLDHEELIFRVLSSWNLKNIKGMTLSYRPEDPYSKRQLAVQRWRDRLRSDPMLRGRVPTGEERGQPPAKDSPPGEEEPGDGALRPKEFSSDQSDAARLPPRRESEAPPPQ